MGLCLSLSVSDHSESSVQTKPETQQVVPVHPLPPHCCHASAQAPSIVVAGAAVVVIGAAVVIASTTASGSHMEYHAFNSTHVKSLTQQVVPVQPCPPHCPQASAQVPLLDAGTAAVVAEAPCAVVVPM